MKYRQNSPGYDTCRTSMGFSSWYQAIGLGLCFFGCQPQTDNRSIHRAQSAQDASETGDTKSPSLLPSGFDVFPASASSGPGSNGSKVCTPENARNDDRNIAELSVTENGFTRVAGQKVSICMDASFSQPVLSGAIAMVARTAKEACGVSCEGSYCGSMVPASTFYSADGVNYRYHSTVELTREPSVHTLDIPEPFQHIRVCRYAAGMLRDRLAVESIAALRNGQEDRPSLPDGFDVYPTLASEGPGANGSKVCDPENVKNKDHNIAELSVTENGFTRVAGQKVSICMDAGFTKPVLSGAIAMVARTAKEACGVSCEGSYCGSPVPASTFYSSDGITYRYHRTVELTRESSVHTLDIPEPFQYFRICRYAAGKLRDRIAIESIAARRNAQEDNPSLPDGFDQFPASTSEGPGSDGSKVCNPENVQYNDGDIAELSVTENGFIRVAGQKVSICMDASFAQPISGAVAMVARTTKDACGVSCEGSHCGSLVPASTFYSTDGISYHYHSTVDLTREPSVHTLDIPEPFQHFRVCRYASGKLRDRIAIESIAAKGSEISECEPGKIMELSLLPGQRAEPCKGLVITPPRNWVASTPDGVPLAGDAKITVKIEADPHKTMIKGNPVYQAGLGAVFQFGPPLEFSHPLKISVPLGLIGGGLPNSETFAVLVDDKHAPGLQLDMSGESSFDLLVPHFSQSVLFNWSQMTTADQDGLAAWMDTLSDNMAPPLDTYTSTGKLSCNASAEAAAIGGSSIGLARKGSEYQIDGHVVTACVDATFPSFPTGTALVRARATIVHSCGIGNCSPLEPDKCLSKPRIQVFYSFDRKNFKFSGERELQGLLPGSYASPEYETLSFDVPKTAKALRVCRWSGSATRSALEIDAILGGPPPCPPASSGFDACDSFCDMANRVPNCGCSGQWKAKSDFVVAKKPAFWPAGISTDNFYDHTGTEARYWERLECTLGDGTKAFTHQNNKKASQANDGAIPSDSSMEECLFRSTGWQNVTGPSTVQSSEAGLNPWKRYKGVLGCECPTPYKPNPLGLLPLQPESYTDDGGHLCNDDSQIQLEAWVSGVCDENHPTCSDNVLRLEGPGECGP